jgi:hypothetical protein
MQLVTYHDSARTVRVGELEAEQAYELVATPISCALNVS